MGETNNNNVVLCLHIKETHISNFWRLDTLGISDSGQKETREELEKVGL